MHLPSLKEVLSAEKWQLRCDLAACYRLVALYGWSDLVFTHISAKLPESVSGAGAHHFLIHPYGLMFDEITASSLVKVDDKCNQVIIVKGVAEAMRVQTGGMGGAFVWPSLIRKLDRLDEGYKS